MILRKILKKFLLYSILVVFFSTLYIQTASSQNLKQYENTNLGIKLFYPSNWSDPSTIEETCSSFLESACFFYWMNPISGDNATPNMWFFLEVYQHSTENPKFLEWCKCNTLAEFMRHKYELAQFRAQSRNNDLLFINDNQTTVGKKNYSAWQMELSNSYREGLDKIRSNELHVFAKINNTFYEFSFTSGGSNEIYSKELPRVKEVINSIDFQQISKPIIKTPSFMSTNETEEHK